MSNSMDDIAQFAKSMLIIGSNTSEQHPVFGAMIRQAVLKRGAKLVVADPRKIDITEFAELHLRQRSGTDVPLLNGIMYIILENGWEDKAFIANRTEGSKTLKRPFYSIHPRKWLKLRVFLLSSSTRRLKYSPRINRWL